MLFICLFLFTYDLRFSTFFRMSTTCVRHANRPLQTTLFVSKIFNVLQISLSGNATSWNTPLKNNAIYFSALRIPSKLQIRYIHIWENPSNSINQRRTNMFIIEISVLFQLTTSSSWGHNHKYDGTKALESGRLWNTLNRLQSGFTGYN